MNRSILSGNQCYREVLVYTFAKGIFNVPPTLMVEIYDPYGWFHYENGINSGLKIGSLQSYGNASFVTFFFPKKKRKKHTMNFFSNFNLKIKIYHYSRSLLLQDQNCLPWGRGVRTKVLILGQTFKNAFLKTDSLIKGLTVMGKPKNEKKYVSMKQL